MNINTLKQQTRSEKLLEWNNNTWVIEEKNHNSIVKTKDGPVNEELIEINIYEIMSIDNPEFVIYLKSDSFDNPLYLQAKYRFIAETIDDIKRMF